MTTLKDFVKLIDMTCEAAEVRASTVTIRLRQLQTRLQQLSLVDHAVDEAITAALAQQSALEQLRPTIAGYFASLDSRSGGAPA